jgi:hypothetical protein
MTDSFVKNRILGGQLLEVLPGLLSGVVLNAMLLGEKDAQLFSSDPREFIKWEDSMAECKHPRLAALELYVATMVHPGWNKLLLGCVAQLLGGPPHHVEAGAYLLTNIKFSKLAGCEALVAELLKSCQGLLDSGSSLLRARYVQVLTNFYEQYTASPETTARCLNLVVGSEFYERVRCAECLSRFLENKNYAACMEAGVGPVIEEILKLLDDVYSERLIYSLQVIIQKFIGRFSGLITKLVRVISEKFSSCLEKMNEGDLDEATDEDVEVVAEGYLAIVRELLKSGEDELASCKEVLRSLILLTLQGAREEVLVQAGELLTYMLQTQPEIDPPTWQFFSLIIYKIRSLPASVIEGIPAEHPLLPVLRTFTSPNEQCLECFSCAIKLFIQKGLATILTSKDAMNMSYLSMLLSTIQYAYKNLENELAAIAISFLFTLIENADTAAGQLRNVEFMLSQMAIEIFNITKNSEIKCLAVEVLCMLVLYQPATIIPAFNERNKITDFMVQVLIRYQSRFVAPEESLRVILAYCALLEQLPLLTPRAQETMPALTVAVLSMSVDRIRRKENNDFDDNFSLVYFEEYLKDYSHPLYERLPVVELQLFLRKIEELHPSTFEMLMASVTPELWQSFLSLKESADDDLDPMT